MAVFFNTSDNKGGFLFVQERQCERFAFVGSFLWEVGNGKGANGANDNREKTYELSLISARSTSRLEGFLTLHDEDPPPASYTWEDTWSDRRVLFSWSIVLAPLGTQVT